jgi:hypothetical protein
MDTNVLLQLVVRPARPSRETKENGGNKRREKQKPLKG